MRRRSVSTFVDLILLAVAFVACTDDSTTSSAPSVDGGGGGIDGGSTYDGAGIVETEGGPPSDGGVTQKHSGLYLRFTHLAESRKDDTIDFCIKPKTSDTFTLVHAPLGKAGLSYGEVGRFIPVQPGEYDYAATTSGNCDDTIEDGDLLIPSGPAIGAWGLFTFALTLTSTGVISLMAPDFELHRDPTQDRITLVDGTGPRDAGVSLSAAWIGSTSVPLDVPNNTRSTTALVPAGETGKVRVFVLGQSEKTVKTVAGGHAMVVVYGSGQMRVCDYDVPIPTSGALSTCDERK